MNEAKRRRARSLKSSTVDVVELVHMKLQQATPRKHITPRCPKHGPLVRYSEPYDAFYCPACNEWLEKTCADGDVCDYCSHRPARPWGRR